MCAGRVQSVALRLVCEREAEIEAFLSREYWTVHCLLEAQPGQAFPAQLVQVRASIVWSTVWLWVTGVHICCHPVA